MDSNSLAAELHQWANEFANIAGIELAVPDRLWAFLASRIAEAGIGVEEPWDVVRITLGGVVRKVRITGHTNGRLSYYIDGTREFGVGMVSAVVDADEPKLADILDHIEGQACQIPVKGNVVKFSS